MAFQEIVERVIEREGGYVNHPNDPGAETNMGISIKAHPKEDIKNLTKERAKEIYYSYYWIPSKAKQFPLGYKKLILTWQLIWEHIVLLKYCKKLVIQKDAN